MGHIRRICAAAAIALAFSGCSRITGGYHNPSSSAAPGVLRIVGAGSMDSLIPELSGIESATDAGMLWAGWLFLVNDKGELEPDLATQVPTLRNGGISRDGLTLTYKLRRGVRWHDGAPFDARDVIFSWRAVMNPANNVVTREGYDRIAAMTAPDPYTVRVKLKQPYAPAVASFFGPSLAPMCILPQHILERLADINHAAYNAKPVGTGPFIVQRYDPSSGLYLKANPHYWRGVPKLREIHYLLVPDPNTRTVMMRTGEADLDYDPASGLLAQLAAIAHVRLLHTLFNEFWYLTFNEAHKPLDDVRMRRAVALSLDRRYIVRNIMHDAAVPANGDQPAYSWAYDPSVKAPPYDPAGAKRLLEQAGYVTAADGYRHRNGNRLSFTFVYPVNDADAVRFAPVFQDAMRRVGIEVHTKGFVASVYYAAKSSGGILNNGRFDIAYEGWVGGVDPDDSTLWTCAQRPPNGYNHSLMCDARVDAAEHLALTSYDRVVRRAAYTRIQRLLNDDVRVDFLYWTKRNDAVREAFGGYRPAPTVTTFWNSWEWSI